MLSADRGFTFDEQNEITSTIPDTFGEEAVSYELIEDIVNDPDSYLTTDRITDREYSLAVNCYNKLQETFVKYPEVKDAIIHLRGSISNVGIHAGGVVISSKPIGHHIPLMKGSGTAVLPVCQADMNDVTFFNGLKF